LNSPSDQRELELLLLDRSVRHGQFTLASGATSSWYIDARPTTMSARGIQLIGRLGLHKIRSMGWTPESVGGLTMGADPVAYAIARASLDDGPMVDAFSVRKEAKGHGTARRVEGNFRDGAAVVVVEDVLTSGGSAKQAVEAIRQAGGTVLGVLAVVDREAGGAAALQEMGVKAVALVTAGGLGLG
jgi:orotate phosphoribosyltransferase